MASKLVVYFLSLTMVEKFDNERFRKLLRAYPAKAVQILHQKFQRRLYGIAFYFTRDQQSSEDIVQETFIHVWENYLSLSEPHQVAIEFYLIRVTRNKSINHYHKATKLTLKISRYYKYTQSLKHIGNAIEQDIIKKELGEEVRTLLQGFPLRERQCLEFKVDEGLSNLEIAKRLNVSVKAVERSITSANKRLRRYGLQNKNNLDFM